jgi:hypothetical protein
MKVALDANADYIVTGDQDVLVRISSFRRQAVRIGVEAFPAQPFNEGSHIPRDGGLKVHGLAGAGMDEGKFPGMKHLPAGGFQDLLKGLGRRRLPSVRPPVGPVSHHRMTYGCTVDPNLMGPAGLQVDLQKRCAAERLLDLPPRL